MAALQVHRDRMSARVQALIGQVLAQLDDLLLERLADLVRARLRTT